MSEVETKNSNGFFKKLFNGDFGLAKTYWVFGVLVGFAFQFALTLLESMGSPFISIIIFNVINVAYAIVLTVGTWRAATKYKGLKLWAILAKVAIILGAIVLIISLSVLMTLPSLEVQ